MTDQSKLGRSKQEPLCPVKEQHQKCSCNAVTNERGQGVIPQNLDHEMICKYDKKDGNECPAKNGDCISDQLIQDATQRVHGGESPQATEAHPPLIQRKTLAQSLRDFRAFMYGEVVGVAIPVLFWFGAFIFGVFMTAVLSLTPEMKPYYCEVITQREAAHAEQ